MVERYLLIASLDPRQIEGLLFLVYMKWQNSVLLGVSPQAKAHLAITLPFGLCTRPSLIAALYVSLALCSGFFDDLPDRLDHQFWLRQHNSMATLLGNYQLAAG
jgi:hypothetical protein